MRLALFRPPSPSPALAELAEVLSRAAAAARRRGARLLLLPAGLWPPRGCEPADGPFAEALAAIARQHRLDLLAGLVEEAFGHRFDAVLVFGDDGTARGHYRRVHLWPGERAWSAGRWGLVAPLGCGASGVLLGADLWVPEYVRALVLTGAALLLGLERDTPAEAESLLRARALENRRPLLWAAKTGPAGLWRPDGSCELLADDLGVFTLTDEAPTLPTPQRQPLLYRPVCRATDGTDTADGTVT